MRVRSSLGNIVLAGALFLLMLTAAARADDKVRELLAERSESFVETVMSGHLSSVRGELTPGARKALTEEAMRQLFGRLTREGGGFREVGQATVQSRNDGTAVATVPVHFERLSLAARIVYEREGPLAKVAEFSVVPLQPSAQRAAPTPVQGASPELSPPYADARLFGRSSNPVSLGDCDFQVILMSPAPAILFLPHFSPETSSAYRGMMRDLMEGLATRGVAVAAAMEPAAECLHPEAAAAAALHWLASDPRVDPDHITVAGFGEAAFTVCDLAETSATLQVALLAPVEGLSPARASSNIAGDRAGVFLPHPATDGERAMLAFLPDVFLFNRVREYSGTDEYFRKSGDGASTGYVVERLVGDLAAFARTGRTYY